jgi:hypothetical protein
LICCMRIPPLRTIQSPETVPKPQSDRGHGHRKYGGPIRRTLHTEVVEPFLKAASQLEAEENLCSELVKKIDQMLTEARVIMPGAQALLGFQVRRGRDDAMVGGR